MSTRPLHTHQRVQQHVLPGASRWVSTLAIAAVTATYFARHSALERGAFAASPQEMAAHCGCANCQRSGMVVHWAVCCACFSCLLAQWA